MNAFKGLKIKKTNPTQEQRDKESYFLSLAPEQRLEMHEELRKKIWGNLYTKNKSFKGLKIIKKLAR